MLKLEKTDVRLINGKQTEARVYKNDVTGNELVTYLLRVDQFQNKWWTFEDLYSLPFIRQLAAKKVLDLYGHGLALEDVKAISGQLKAILRSTSPEKYELAYAKTNELENLAETMADPVKQCIGLCTVYLLLNDEGPETWTGAASQQKLTYLGLDVDSQAFFLSWWTGIMQRSGTALKGLSQIVSTLNQQSASDERALSS